MINRILDRLYPIITYNKIMCVDMYNICKFEEIHLELGITDEEFNTWVYSKFPDKKFALRFSDCIIFYKGNDIHRDKGPAVLWDDGGVQYWKNGEGPLNPDIEDIRDINHEIMIITR